MDKETKLILWVFGLSLVGFWALKKYKSTTPTTTPTQTPTPTTTPKSGCPAGTKEVVVNCLVAPCPLVCVDAQGNTVPTTNVDAQGYTDSGYYSGIK